MGLINSFIYAARGLWHIIRSERNARIHIAAAILVLLASIYLGVSPAEQAAIFFAVIIVFLAEIFNTALEKTLDIIKAEHQDLNGGINHHSDTQIGKIKDMAAGSVLVASIGAAIIGFVILWPYLLERLWHR